MSIRRSIKVRWLRLLRRMNSLDLGIFRKEDLTDQQKMGIKIFEKTVSIKEADIFMSPLSDSIYIEINDIYIILEGNDLQIINGKFRYDLHFNEQVRTRLRHRVLQILESRRVLVEKRIKIKSERTLNSIFDDVKEIKERENVK